MTFWLPVGLVVVILAGFDLLARRRRRRLLERLRAEWGRPAERTRDLPEISHYHRVFAVDRESPLDARTGEDLDLDAVFAVLDRTESDIGQQLLYHRLRTTPTPDDLAAFEALTTRLSEDAASRESILVSLSGLRGHPGQVWWLTQPGILETRRRDVMFPVIGLVVPVALMLTIVWPVALVAVILGVIANMIVRYVTALRLGPPLGPFRQVAPLLAAAEALRPLVATCGLPCGSTLSSDLAEMRRLRRIARWVGHDPMTSDDLTNVIHEAANMLFLLDLVLLFLASREIGAHGPALVRTVASVGTVDAAISVASYRVGAAGWTRPVFRVAFRRLDDARVASPAAAGGRAELRRAGAAAGSARHRIEHVRQVHVSQDRRRERDSRADHQHLSGDQLSCARLPGAKPDRPERRSDRGPELLPRRG